MNQIAKLETVRLESADGPKTAIIVAVDLDDPTQLDSFMPTIVEKIKLQRTCSPPDTSLLLITLIGDTSADAFAASWSAHIADDQIMAFYMSRMSKADVVHGTKDGRTLGVVSLIRAAGASGGAANGAPDEGQQKKWWQFWK